MNFRFPKRELYLIYEIIDLSGGQTERNRYFCDMLTAGCIVIRRLAALCRLRYIEKPFGRRDYAMSEVFWEAIEDFIDSYREIM